jgi:hypothetical protein
MRNMLAAIIWGVPRVGWPRAALLLPLLLGGCVVVPVPGKGRYGSELSIRSCIGPSDSDRPLRRGAPRAEVRELLDEPTAADATGGVEEYVVHEVEGRYFIATLIPEGPVARIFPVEQEFHLLLSYDDTGHVQSVGLLTHRQYAKAKAALKARGIELIRDPNAPSVSFPRARIPATAPGSW